MAYVTGTAGIGRYSKAEAAFAGGRTALPSVPVMLKPVAFWAYQLRVTACWPVAESATAGGPAVKPPNSSGRGTTVQLAVSGVPVGVLPWAVIVYVTGRSGSGSVKSADDAL